MSESPTPRQTTSSLLMRGAIWVAIGALIAAALVCVFWVLFGSQNGLVARAFLTILLLAGFAGVAILEASMASKRPDWLSLASMITWIVALLIGAVKIWQPWASDSADNPATRVFYLALAIGLLQLALVHVRLYRPAAQRYVTTFTRVIYYTTIAFLVILVGLVIFYLTFPHHIDYSDMYWRIVVAVTILVAVGTTLIPLLNALFAPKAPPRADAPELLPWPTYGDGITPLPALADGSPDWNAYYAAEQRALAGPPAWSTAPSAAAPIAPVPATPTAPVSQGALPPIPPIPGSFPTPTPTPTPPVAEVSPPAPQTVPGEEPVIGAEAGADAEAPPAPAEPATPTPTDPASFPPPPPPAPAP